MGINLLEPMTHMQTKLRFFSCLSFSNQVTFIIDMARSAQARNSNKGQKREIFYIIKNLTHGYKNYVSETLFE